MIDFRRCLFHLNRIIIPYSGIGLFQCQNQLLEIGIGIADMLIAVFYFHGIIHIL